MTFEEFLAEVSDAIILFVESPGSFCELGAFAYADSLFSDKMIVVLDEAYRNSRSFISTGPVLKASDNGSKVVYAEIKYGALLASEELRSVVLDLTSRMKTKISSINKRTINKDTNVYISSFIPEVLEIIRLAQPILSADLIQLYKDIKGIDTFTFIKRNGEAFSREIQVTYIWKMLEVAQIVRIDEGYLGFSSNAYKSWFCSKKCRREITGLILTETGKVSVGLEKRLAIKKMVYERIMHGRGDPDTILGSLAFLKDVEPNSYNSLLIKYAAYCDGDVIDAIKTGPKPHRVITLDLPDI